MTPLDLVLVEDEGPVRALVLNRPSRLNAFTAASYRALARALDAADQEPGVGVALLAGAGRAFSSGVDLDALADPTVPVNEFSETFGQLLQALQNFSKPLIAAVHGAAVGFGATILLHCDIVLVAEDARVRMPFTVLGTAPEAGSSVLLPLVVGPQHAADLLFTSRWMAGTEAVQIGLAARCFPSATLHDEARALAHEIAGQPPAALAAAKQLLRSGRAEAVTAAIGREGDEARSLSKTLGPIRREGRG